MLILFQRSQTRSMRLLLRQTQVRISHSRLARFFYNSPDITESTAVPQPSKTPSAAPVPTSSASSAAAQPTVVSDVSDASTVDQKRSNAVGGGIVGACVLI
jgi:hypothetical protein